MRLFLAFKLDRFWTCDYRLLLCSILDDVGSLLKMMILFNNEEARILQTNFEQLILMVEKSLSIIWPPEDTTGYQAHSSPVYLCVFNADSQKREHELEAGGHKFKGSTKTFGFGRGWFCGQTLRHVKLTLNKNWILPHNARPFFMWGIEKVRHFLANEEANLT